MRMVASSIADFRYAFRRIVEAPMASAAAVLALACGISTAAGTWNLLSSLLITPLPMVATNELFEISIERVVPPRLVSDSGHAYRVYAAVRDSGVFSEVAVAGVQPVRLGADQNDAAVDAAFVSTGFFTTLGVTVQAGRAEPSGARIWTRRRSPPSKRTGRRPSFMTSLPAMSGTP